MTKSIFNEYENVTKVRIINNAILNKSFQHDVY